LADYACGESAAWKQGVVEGISYAVSLPIQFIRFFVGYGPGLPHRQDTPQMENQQLVYHIYLNLETFVWYFG
jgi:hypothetical protein